MNIKIKKVKKICGIKNVVICKNKKCQKTNCEKKKCIFFYQDFFYLTKNIKYKIIHFQNTVTRHIKNMFK